MQKDFKIGLAVGLLFVVGVAVWLSTRPDLSTEARALQKSSNTLPITTQSEDRPVTPNIESAFANASADKNRTSNVAPAEKTLRTHVVQKGDTLSAIAAEYYGSSNQWPKIVAANRSTLPDPDKLIPGTRLLIPD